MEGRTYGKPECTCGHSLGYHLNGGVDEGCYVRDCRCSQFTLNDLEGKIEKREHSMKNYENY